MGNRNNKTPDDVEFHCECENEVLQYAYMEIEPDDFRLISAREYVRFDELLRIAKEEDKEIFVDMDTSDDYPFQLCYGAIGLNIKISGWTEDLIGYIEKSKNCAFICVEEDTNELIASSYADIVVEPNEDSGNFIPFVALMRTPYSQHDADTSVTMFPYSGRLVFEDMINRPFALACREIVPTDATLDNWKEKIDLSLLHKYASKATIVENIPEEDYENE